MGMSFLESPSYLFTSESVTEGHPDKLCDQVSDAILDAILAQDAQARVACETCVTTGLIIVLGEITTTSSVDIPSTIRETVREIGYTSPALGFDYNSCGIILSLKEQSQDIAQGVNRSLEAKEEGDLQGEEDDLYRLGAGDQGMMVGFACTETPELMPLPISLAHRITRRLAQVRKEGLIPYLRPDGKAQVTVEYAYGVPRRVDTVLVSAQHDPDVPQERIREDIIELVIKAVVPSELRDERVKYLVNPTGRFVIGGPAGDSGLTGRKWEVDTYGSAARHGGGCFSGKDPTKVDRSGSYAARYVAKNLVAAGLADRVEIQIAYAIGVARPVSISLETFGTGKVPDAVIHKLIQKHFDLRPGAIIKNMDLRRPIYKDTACYGAFGRTDLDLPWEKTDKAETLRQEALGGGSKSTMQGEAACKE